MDRFSSQIGDYQIEGFNLENLEPPVGFVAAPDPLTYIMKASAPWSSPAGMPNGYAALSLLAVSAVLNLLSFRALRRIGELRAAGGRRRAKEWLWHS